MIEKSVVPREVILLIKKPPRPNLNPAEKEEAMGSGAPEKKLPENHSRAICWSRGTASRGYLSLEPVSAHRWKTYWAK